MILVLADQYIRERDALSAAGVKKTAVVEDMVERAELHQTLRQGVKRATTTAERAAQVAAAGGEIG